ncbi:MAG: TetR/AcrR family transcriptional regulator, partial [Bifidobacteriaceae bacterium]|nr:TetR/AcrR family transcriptional regulator [Bifidobacteriaceae bacterium]
MVYVEGRFDLFHSLDPAKRDRSFDAALAEFGAKGFKRASTNAIVERAGIGKGMLFYYFRSKAELFQFICEYTVEFVENEYFNKLVFESPDILERYRRLAEAKRRAQDKSPLIMSFAVSFFLPENRDFLPQYLSTSEDLRDRTHRELLEGADYSLFRDDIPPDRILEYLDWLTKSYEDATTARISNSDTNA